MINEILKILEENTVLDKDLNRIIKMDYPYKETLACELDDLFAKRIVITPTKITVNEHR